MRAGTRPLGQHRDVTGPSYGAASLTMDRWTRDTQRPVKRGGFNRARNNGYMSVQDVVHHDVVIHIAHSVSCVTLHVHSLTTFSTYP